MNTIEQYLFRRAGVMFVATFVAIVLIFWITQSLSRINIVSDSAASVVAFLKVATLGMPTAIPEVLPFAVAIGLAQTLSTMNTDSELAVINAAGASRMTIIRPALALAFIAGLTSFIVEGFVAPAGRYQMREVIAEAHGDLLTMLIQEGGFTQVDKKLYVQVAERKPGGLLAGIFVADQRDPQAELIYYAKEGAVVRDGEQKLLVMTQGEVHRRSPTGELSVVRFASYAFDLDSLRPASKDILRVMPKDRSFAYLFAPPADDPYLKSNPRMFRTEIIRRLTNWTYCIAFALIVLIFSANPVSQRQARIPPMVTALATATAVRWVVLFIEGRASKITAFTHLQYIWPAAVLIVATLLLVRNQDFGKSSDRLHALGQRAWSTLAPLLARLPHLRARRHIP